MSLPHGYFEMDATELNALDLETARAVYAKHYEVASYHAGTKFVKNYVDGLRVTNTPKTPGDWIVAIRGIVCDCPRCSGTGIYNYGGTINGRPVHSVECARCSGKGRMTFDDQRRGKAYDNYAIVRACRM